MLVRRHVEGAAQRRSTARRRRHHRRTGKLLYAAVTGTISKVYVDTPGALAGNGLRIAQDNGTYFTYLHMDTFAEGIELGAKVTAGQVVGTVGSTGNSATPHLHFEVHPGGGAPVNPYPLVKPIDACNVTAPRALSRREPDPARQCCGRVRCAHN